MKDNQFPSALPIPPKPARASIRRQDGGEEEEGGEASLDPNAKAALQLALEPTEHTEEHEEDHSSMSCAGKHKDDPIKAKTKVRVGDEHASMCVKDGKGDKAEARMKMSCSSHRCNGSSRSLRRGFHSRRRVEPDLEATGAVVPVPPGDHSSKDFDHECTCTGPLSMSMSIPGAVRVRGIDSTDDDDSESEIDEVSEAFTLPPQPLELQRNGNMSIPSRPGAFSGPPVCFSLGSSNLTLTTDATSGSSVLSLLDPLRGSLVKANEGLNEAEIECIERDLEEALEVKPMPNAEEQDKKAPSRCVGSRFYLLLRAICVLWVIGFVMGLLLRIDPNIKERRDYYRRHPPYANKRKDQVYPPFNGSDTILKPSTLKLIQDHQDSPQYQANAWMAQDPLLHNYTDAQKLQRFALATQYYALNGNEWFRKDHWLSYNVSECYWYTSASNNTFNIIPPSSCNERGQIIYQDLSQNNLEGLTPKEAQLPSLVRVDQSNNGLRGRLPYFSSTIQELIFSHNDFEGPVVVDPDTSLAQNNLRVLKLDSNRFSGLIHKGFNLFPHMQVLNLTNNQFKGTVPKEVQYMRNLTYFGMGHNLYEGTIPTEFGLLTQLTELDLSGNPAIQRTLPSELGSLHALTKLNLAETAITGDLPEELCARQALGELELVANCSLVHCCS